MDKWSIVRSLHHDNAGSADQILFTGYPGARGIAPNGPGNTYPSCGSIVGKQTVAAALPTYVMIPRMVPGTSPGYLGPAYRPFETTADPARDEPFRVPNLSLVNGLEVHRVTERRELLTDLDRIRDQVDRSGEMEAADEFRQQAWNTYWSRGPEGLRSRCGTRSIRERYGFMPAYQAPTPDRCGVPAWSQRILLARRLAEHGVRLVTVDCRWWDTHVKGYETMRVGFLLVRRPWIVRLVEVDDPLDRSTPERFDVFPLIVLECAGVQLGRQLGGRAVGRHKHPVSLWRLLELPCVVAGLILVGIVESVASLQRAI